MTNTENEKQVTNLQMLEFDHHKFAVELCSGNVNVNLTQMAKPFGSLKKPNNWLRSEESKEYLKVLSTSQKREVRDLMDVKNGGANRGTWCTDYRIAMRFAQWLSPEFSIAVDEMLVNLLRGDSVLSKPFNGIEPAINQGKPWYNYLDVLESLGHSRRSGSVAARKRSFPEQFIKLFGRNFVSPDFCNYLKLNREAIQLRINFTETKLLSMGLNGITNTLNKCGGQA